jgi:hypothetical protein
MMHQNNDIQSGGGGGSCLPDVGESTENIIYNYDNLTGFAATQTHHWV